MRRFIGFDVLGPVVHRWLLGLQQYIAYFDDDDTKFLFCSRAGVRILELYEIYLHGLGRKVPSSAEMFWISRIALCKGLYASDPVLATNIISREYAHGTIRDVVEGIFGSSSELRESLNLTTPDLDAEAEDLGEWLKSNSPVARVVVNYLEQSSAAFDVYLKDVLGGASRGVLVDSGWQGTGQSLLHHGCSDIEWYGLYVGRMLSPSADWVITDRVIGLLFQAERYDPERPETAICLHRHLFETLLEPNGPSVEEVVGGPCGATATAQIAANETADVSVERDPLYILVREYLQVNAGLGPAEILARYSQAATQLARILVKPNREEALALYTKSRSADFGKNIEVPVLVTDIDAEDLPEKWAKRDDRIQKSLWPQGQVALEFGGKLRDDVQSRVSGLTDDIGYFDPTSELKDYKHKAGLPADEERPLVAIVTRTKNRPLLLRRAAESVAQQTFDNYLWVIVNDGGDEDVVRDTIRRCAVDRRRIRLVSNSQSIGMEAASNLGVRHVESDYVLIHDDDDSLHPDFLKEAVAYLESAAGRRYGGVITQTEYVSEEIRGDEVIIHSRIPYMDWVRNIQLAELMVQNLFAPISFLYRRDLYDEIGGYNPELPVLGDWFFNLEFVLKADIKVLPKRLAYYHHRDRGDSSRAGVYSNSVIGGQSKHEEFAAVSRNMFVRKYAKDSTVASMAMAAYYAQDMRHRLNLQGRSNHASGQGADALGSGTYSELDRLWLLSQIQQAKAQRSPLSFPRIPTVNQEQSLLKLAQIAKKYKIAVPTPASFDDEAYLAANPDVASAVKAGGFRSGYQHYTLNGHLENRARTNRV